MDSELEVAKRTAADAGTAGEIQTSQAKCLGPDLHNQAGKRPNRFRPGQGALTEVSVA